MSNDKVELNNEELQKAAGGNNPKSVIGTLKLQIPGGKATPAPPIGPALGNYGVNIIDFINEFNARTKEYKGHKVPIPTVITIYADHSFSFVTKAPPASLDFLHEVNPDPESHIREVDHDTLKDLVGNK